jgi:hypothetical protein
MMRRILAGATARLNRWSTLIQLAFFESNSRGDARFTGMARARRTMGEIAIWAIAPMFPLIGLGVLGLGRGPLFWVLQAAATIWVAALISFILVVGAIALYRAARLRLAMDRAGLPRYPRYPRRPGG